MKFVNARSFADPDAAARKLIEIANASEPYMDGRILIERLNGPMLFEFNATPAEYKAASMARSTTAGLLLHESGTCTHHAGRRGPVRIGTTATS